MTGGPAQPSVQAWSRGGGLAQSLKAGKASPPPQSPLALVPHEVTTWSWPPALAWSLPSPP